MPIKYFLFSIKHRMCIYFISNLMFNFDVFFISIFTYFFNLLWLFIYVKFFYDKGTFVFKNIINRTVLIMFIFIFSGIPPLSIFVLKFIFVKILFNNSNIIYTLLFALFNTAILYFYYNGLKVYFFKNNAYQKKNKLHKNKIKNFFFFSFIMVIFNVFFIFYLEFFILTL